MNALTSKDLIFYLQKASPSILNANFKKLSLKEIQEKELNFKT
jgi:hypothetical protein